MNKLCPHPVKHAAAIVLAVLILTGCATLPGWISAAGPSRQQVQEKRDTGRLSGICLIDVNDNLARKLSAMKKLGDFTEAFPDSSTTCYIIGPGDIIEVSVWETPPAMLFGAVQLDLAAGAGTTRMVVFPEQMIASDGSFSMPFAGRIPVQGRTTQQIEDDVIKRLTGKANQPQVLVRVMKNNTSNVTIVGEVASSTLMPLTPKGERLLDALAAAGGVKQQIGRMALQLTRTGKAAIMPLDLVIRDPRQNILLKPGDVLTALYQSQSFSALGATGKNEEIPFEAQGISLAQALARSGGLNDNRADARAVFLFRFEDAKLDETRDLAAVSPDGTVPVVYQIDLRDPASLFVAQHFPVQNRDVIYVANSPEAEFSKFLRLVVSVASPATSVTRYVDNVTK